VGISLIENVLSRLYVNPPLLFRLRSRNSSSESVNSEVTRTYMDLPLSFLLTSEAGMGLAGPRSALLKLAQDVFRVEEELLPSVVPSDKDTPEIPPKIGEDEREANSGSSLAPAIRRIAERTDVVLQVSDLSSGPCTTMSICDVSLYTRYHQRGVVNFMYNKDSRKLWHHTHQREEGRDEGPKTLHPQGL